MRAPDSAADGTRTWMLAMPVPTTSRSVAARKAADCVRHSLPTTSGMNSEPKPSSSISRATCCASGMDQVSPAHQTPMRDGKSMAARVMVVMVFRFLNIR